MKNQKKKEEEEEGGVGGGGGAGRNRSLSCVTSYDRSRSCRRNGFNSI